MLNPNYRPSGQTDYEDRILETLEREGGWWSPTHLGEEFGVSRQNISHYLNRLSAAGWIYQPKSGVYAYRADPRKMSDDALAELFTEYVEEMTGKQLVLTDA